MLASNLRRYAELAGLDSPALARAAAIDLPDLEQFLTGAAHPCPRQQHRLAHALGVTVADLHRESAV